MNNKNIISQQIERGINILRSLNDLEEIEVDKYGLPHIKFCEGQKFYDEKKLGELETKVQNWMTESETCLSTLGITLDNDNPFQMQSYITRMIDKRKALIDDIQTGINYLKKNTDIKERSKVFPDELRTPEAKQLMQKLMNAGLLDTHRQPINLSGAEKGYLADEISSRLQIKNKWKVMGALWNVNPQTLRQGNCRAIDQKRPEPLLKN